MATTTTTQQRTHLGATQADTLAAMQILFAADVPVLLWGDPGTGKTHTIEAFAQRAGWQTVSVIASIHDPTDFAGLPVRTDAGVVFEPPAWARRTAEYDGVSLVFFDEVNTATPATQNALMRVVLKGQVGDLDLGEGVRFAAAANPPSQNSAAWDLSAPLANRFAHLDWPVGPVERTRQQREDGPVRRRQPAAIDLPPQNAHLMAKGEDPGVTLVT